MPPDIWAVSRPSELIWRDWDELGVVYNGTSGDTHLVSALGIEILALLLAAPRAEQDILAELADAMPDDLETDGAQVLVQGQLRQLRDNGLIAVIRRTP